MLKKIIISLCLVAGMAQAQLNRSGVDALWASRQVPITAQRQTTWLSFYNVIDNPALGTGSVVMSSAIGSLTPSSPAGSNTQIQYNNSGVFGSSSNLVYDGVQLISNGIRSTGALSVTSTSTLNGLTVIGTMSVSGTSTLGTILVMPEASTITIGTTTGLKFGASGSRIGLFGVTPVVQQAAATDLGVALSNLGARIAGTAYPITTSGAISFGGTIGFTGTSAITLGARNFVLDATTGTKFGTATTQKISFWNATPVVRQTNAIAAAAFVANTSGTLNDSATYGGYTIGQLVAILKLYGLIP